MKTKEILISIVLLFQISSFNAQSLVYKEASLSHPAEFWKPVAIGNNGTNEINGLQFYSFESECNNEKVTFVKLINLNSDPVIVSYQTSEGAPIINVDVPALYTIEGVCVTSDNNKKNLVLTVFNNKTKEEKEKIQKYIFSHISITKIQ